MDSFFATPDANITTACKRIEGTTPDLMRLIGRHTHFEINATTNGGVELRLFDRREIRPPQAAEPKTPPAPGRLLKQFIRKIFT